MDRPLLSIVIANLNYGRFLDEAIQSVVSQKCPDVELIVIDGGSTDNSCEIIRKYSHHISYWVSEPDKGQSDAFNKGFSHANGKYLTWLNADDVLVDGCIKKVISEIKRHPKCEWFTGNFYRFTLDGRIVEIGWGPHYYPCILQKTNSPVVVFGPTSFFAKNLWERMGKIDERLSLIMDTDLWIRFIKAGIKQRRINCFCWAFRMHSNSKTAEYDGHVLDDSSARKMHEENEYVMRKNGYRASRFLHLLLRIWRLIDGSFVKRAILQQTMKSINVKGFKL